MKIAQVRQLTGAELMNNYRSGKGRRGSPNRNGRIVEGLTEEQVIVRGCEKLIAEGFFREEK